MKPKIVPAGLSLLCPGLGQLIQGRKDCVLHFIVYALTLVIPLMFGLHAIDFWTAHESFFCSIYNTILGFGPFCLVLPFFAVLFSSLDAAFWEPENPSPLHSAMAKLGCWTVVIVFFLLIFLPAVAAAREASKRMQCTNNLKSIGFALHNYQDKYGCFPPAYTVDENGRPLHSWRVLILPCLGYKECNELYEKIRLEEPWNSEYNRQFHQVKIPVFSCPAAKWKGIETRILPRLEIPESCHYSVVIGKETIFPGAESTKIPDITDGTSNTILVAERLLPICWMDPEHEILLDAASKGVNRNFYGIGSPHRGGANVVLADGSVRYLSERESPKNFRAYLTKAGGETVTIP